ncbi:MAG: hypothetical protein L3J08_08475 [Flavobacteriaceae bacterium]|nr:hypothetical protein [Flavobacteriaceae bacterium]
MIEDFSSIDSLNYTEFCLENNIFSDDSKNIEKYYTIKILHKLFTSQTASNGSKGEILSIPYLWHWIQPNPRHEIRFVKDSSLLKNVNPPVEFSKYNSYADIDRTPYLFLSDLMQENSKYFSESFGTFSTFGWCSEREMAFVALINIFKFEGKVVAEGNHSWSEFVIPLQSKTGELQNFKVTVDNTYNTIDWSTIEPKEIHEWEKYLGNTKQANWYNLQAKSKTELNKIKNHIVPKLAMQRIENKVAEYLNRKTN